MDYTGQNLQGRSFKGANLMNANFKGSDLRGADFSSANLEGTDFSNAKTGMRVYAKILVFICSLVVSLFSGYVAMLAGTTIQSLLKSGDPNHEIAGYVTIAFFVVFVGAAMWKGVFEALRTVYLALIALAVAAGLFMYFTGLGTGIGALYGLFALLLMALMFIVGTVSRATAGTLASTVLFLVVALGGGMFGKSLGGGFGTVAMALACAFISKRALKKGESSSFLGKIAITVSTLFGTSFKNADLTNANFSNTKIDNTDFREATLTGVNWENAKKKYSLGDDDK
jgi:hypothetical protein